MSSEKTFTQKEVAEEVKKAVKQTNTFASRVSMGLSAANVPPEVMKFYIDNPVALNNRCGVFLARPTYIECTGQVGGPALRTAAYIDTFFADVLDVYVINTTRVATKDGIFCSSLRDEVSIMVVDRLFADIAITKLGKNVAKLDSVIVVGKDGVAEAELPMKTRPFFYDDWKGVVKHFADLRCKKVSDEIAAVLTKLKLNVVTNSAD